jgi:glycerol uptake facilitator-like aquaporin
MDDVELGQALAEAVGAFVITFVAAGAIVVDAAAIEAAELGLLGIAAATGIAYGVATAIARTRAEGHVNPAVSLAAWLAGRISIARAGIYAVSQIVGGVVAAAVVVSLMPSEAIDAAQAGATTLAASTGLLTAVTWELVATFLYALAVFALVLDERANGGAIVAGAVFVATALAYPFTGAGLNPARSLGPALLGSTWSLQWVYAVGPVLGASLAAGLYEGVLREVVREPG